MTDGVSIGQARGVSACVCGWLRVGDSKHKILNSVINKCKMVEYVPGAVLARADTKY